MQTKNHMFRSVASRVQVCGDSALEGGAEDPEAGGDAELHPGGPALLLLLLQPLLLPPLGGAHLLCRGRGLL